MTDLVPEAESPDLQPIQPAPPRRNLIHRVFVGPLGLRAGWKVLIFFLLFAAGGFCLRPLVKMSGTLDPKAAIPPGMAFLNEFLTMVDVLLSTAIMAKLID